ncbi:restriction endonuclease subunit S [Providencia rettgeri]|uniref:restriction endonuclease subunit S n=1 Tax=Providencia hangzhouensis TaxID=3031799 RepID=UPI002273FF1F|nr:restriction endonuclease subunit S [Providencia rettgeri]
MSLDKLPEEWRQTSILTSITHTGLISDGDWVESKDQDPNGSVRLIQLADIGDGYFKNKSERFMTPEKVRSLNCTYLIPGDVLVARMPEPLGRACIFPDIGKNAVTVVDICLLRTSTCSAINNNILVHWLNSPAIRSIIEQNSSGSTRKRITRKKLEQFIIPLPPLAEQKIIAEKLDTLLAQVDSTKARLEQVLQILKRFRQAVLAAAVSGKLTHKTKKNSPWQEVLLNNIASHIVDCPHSTPKWSSSGKYCVRTTAFNPFKLDLSGQGFVDEATYQNRTQRLKPKEDDILYSREGTIGIACQIPKGVELCLGQRMVLIRASDKILSKYLTIVLNSNKILTIVRSKTMGSTVPRINMSDIRSYPIPLPSLSEQHEIICSVEQLFAYTDSIEKQVNNALTRVNSLTQSILAKAFCGELTAQWRAENPDLISGENSAAALLEKIKAERDASVNKKASRKNK